MNSIAEKLKEELEARGEYVVKANTSWFAIFPRTWRDRAEKASRDGRNGPNLVVYRTKSDNPRDHHVIPHKIIRGLLVEDTLSNSANGPQRWNLTIENGKLHISHRAGKIDVSEFHGLRLLVEYAGPPPARTEPPAYDWRDRVRSWAMEREFTQRDLNAIVAYFERAFDNARCPERAWFGVHKSMISLVVGGIFLAAIFHRPGKNHGLWLLVDADVAKLRGLDYEQVESTRKSTHKLRWAHSKSINLLDTIIECEPLWDSFSRASEKILSSSAAAARDAVQLRRGKVCLNEFWPESDDIPLTNATADERFASVTRAVEGNTYFRLSRHRYRERKLRDAKIEEVRKRTSGNRLRCEVPECGFDFEERYGDIGHGFAHVHHTNQLSDLESEREVTLDELVVVCANCHAMIHRGGENRQLAGLIRKPSKIDI